VQRRGRAPPARRRTVAGIPGSYELDWDHVAGCWHGWQPPAEADLRLDAVAPFDVNTARLDDLLNHPPEVDTTGNHREGRRFYASVMNAWALRRVEQPGVEP
jgi:hypothetical protein